MRNKAKSKILSLALAAVMVFTLLPVTASAAVETTVTAYGDLQTEAALSSSTYDTIKLTADITDGASQLDIGRDLTLDLNGYDLTINVSSGNGIKIASGVTLTIIDSDPGANQLSVTNTLLSTSIGNGAGINTTDGTLIIESGTVTATSNSDAGIGGGSQGAGGNITITGSAHVTATSEYGAGIGGGSQGAGGNITISGSARVTANGGNWGAGIGGGYQGAGGTINISGNAQVTATGNWGAGIGGGGVLSGGYGGAGGTITISGSAQVTATGNWGAGIGGGGGDGGSYGGAGGTITISGSAQVTATGNRGAGIGGGGVLSGGYGGAGGTITISGSAQVTATGNSGAGIGGGGNAHSSYSTGGAGGDVTIGAAAKVTAKSTDGRYIGGGQYATDHGTLVIENDSITINRSTVTSDSTTVEQTAGYGGTITNSGLTYTVTPSSGYVIDQVYIDGVSQTISNRNSFTYTFTDDLKAHTIVAIFAYTVNFNTPTNGTLTVASANGSLSSGAIVRGGQKLAISVTPDANYALSSLIVNGADVTASVTNGVYAYTVGTLAGETRNLATGEKVLDKGPEIVATFTTISSLGDQAIDITVPVTGVTPQATIANGTGYTGTITWSDSPATFAASTVYTATVVLTSATGYQWPSTAPIITVDGGTVAGEIVDGTGTGNTLTFTVTFLATTAETPQSITAATYSTGPYSVDNAITSTAGAYTANDGGTEGIHTYKWYRADDDTGMNAAVISGAQSLTYTPDAADFGKYICIETTPMGAFSTTGSPVKSAYIQIGVKLTAAAAGGSGASSVTAGGSASTVAYDNSAVNIEVTKNTSADTVAWSDGSAGGSFGDSTAASTTYTPPAAPAGDITLTATLTAASAQTYAIAIQTNNVLASGVTAAGVVTPSGDQAASTNITVTITLTGTAAAAGTHTVGLTSATLGSGITTPGTVTKTVAAGESVTSGNTFAFTFTMPSGAVNDLVVTHTFSQTVDAQTPSITGQPAGAAYNLGGAATALSVTASVTDGGVLSYQWYSNTTDSTTGGSSVSGATSATYTPSTATAGTTYYYVIVTNTNTGASGAQTAAATSGTAAVTVNVPTYTVTVLSGTGGGTYAQGATVTITADAAPSGQQFKEWTATGLPNTTYSANPLTFTMPAGAVQLTATYEAIPPTVSGVAVNPSTKTLNPGDAFQFSATVSGTNNPPQTVTWSVSGGNGSSTIGTDGTLTVDGGESDGATLTVTATSTYDTGVSGTATVTITTSTPPTPTVTSVTVTPDTITLNTGDTHTFSAAVNGTDGPSQAVTWTVEGGNGTTAITSGGALTIAADETATTLTVRATSDEDSTKSGTATVTVYQPPVFVAVTDITGVPGAATAGTALTLTGTVVPSNATNQTIAWSVKDAGTTGATISGATLQTTAAGTVTVTATIASGTATGDYTQDFTITVSSSTPVGTAPTITTSSLSNGTKGTAYSRTLTATGDTPITWSVDSGSLPDGLSLNTSTGMISGTPTTTGTFSFTVKAENSAGSATKSFSITISSSGGSSGGGSSATTTYTVTFNSQGGSDISKITGLTSGGKATKPTDPTRTGYTFTGWYKESACKNVWNFNTDTVTQSITLYAGWKEVQSSEAHSAYISGYPDVTFRPDNSMTRAEAATLFYNLLGGTAATGSGFTDVSSGDWYYDAVTALSGAGIISGYEDGTFRPNSTITRAEFVTMAMRFAGVSGKTGSSGFDDVGSAHWAAGHITAAAQAGYISGYLDGTFKPGGLVTRAEAATILNNLSGCDGLSEGTSFTDLPKSHWAYEAVTAAATGHTHE